MAHELYKRYRPKSLKTVVGQSGAVKVLEEKILKKTIPHAILFDGPSGCGKTTLARILSKELGCSEQDYKEINAANANGVDMVREIISRAGLSPLSGAVKVYVIDECHQLTSQAQNAFLKLLEDCPKHVYFFLATTDPQKLLPTIKTRCTSIKVQGLNAADCEKLIRRVVEKEGIEGITPKVEKAIIEHSEMSARKVLVLLDAIMGIKTEEEMISAIRSSDYKTAAIDLARKLIAPGVKWAVIAPLLKGLQEEPEGVRHLVLGYCNSIVLSNGPLTSRAMNIMIAFERNFYDSKKAGLTLACWQAVHSK